MISGAIVHERHDSYPQRAGPCSFFGNCSLESVDWGVARGVRGYGGAGLVAGRDVQR